ncbi:IS110 family transposase [bacterium]|nr:IS110 family transposase [bacterium]
MSNKAARSGPIKPDIVVVGIDVAKRRHVAAIRQIDGRVARPFGFGNDRAGFEMLVGRAEAAVRASGARRAYFALEATGHYGHVLQQYLLDRGFVVIGINPAHTKKIKEVFDGSPEKSDAKDAVLISELAAQGRGRPVFQPEGVYADLRRLGKLREQLTNERTRCLNRYTGLVDLVFPELVDLVYDVTCPTIRKLFMEFPTAEAIGRRQYRVIGRRLRDWSIGHFDAARCRAIHEAARTSVGMRPGLDAFALQMRQILCSLKLVESQIAEVEAAQTALLAQVPYAGHLITIPEVSTVTVATVLGEAGDLRQYSTAEALIKLAGLNLYSISSGTFQGRTRISKRGRPLLRRIVFLAALRMSKEGRPLAEFHGRLGERLAKPQVAVAGARKLLRMMYALARDGVDFREEMLAVKRSEAA